MLYILRKENPFIVEQMLLEGSTKADDAPVVDKAMEEDLAND